MNRLQAPLAAQFDVPLGDWQPVVGSWASSPAGRATLAAVDARIAAGAVVYPSHVLRALELTSLADTRVVILGQDPYHGPGQAEGLAFSVAPGVAPPPSLRNIFKELRLDLGLHPPAIGSLVPWARQGVLLLNAALTVEDGQAGSHAALGWHALTTEMINILVKDQRPKAFLLWGRPAQKLLPEALRRSPHAVFEANHPSPLSAVRPPVPFIGCGHFGAANRFLAQAGRGQVSWQLL